MGDVSSQAVKGMKYRARGTNPLHGFLLGLLISFGLTVFYKRMNHSLTVEGVGNGGGGYSVFNEACKRGIACQLFCRVRSRGPFETRQLTSLTLKRIRLSYLISHDEHVDDPRRPVAPVNQSVALIAQRRGEVTRTESLVADVVDTGPNQLG